MGFWGSLPIWGPPHLSQWGFWGPLQFGVPLMILYGVLGSSPPIWGPPWDPMGDFGVIPPILGSTSWIPMGIWGPLQFGTPLMIPYGVLGVPSDLGSSSWIPLGILGSPPIWGPPHDPIWGSGVIPPIWGPPRGSHGGFWGHPPQFGVHLMDPTKDFGVMPPFWGPPLWIPTGIWGPLRFGAPLMILYGVLGVPSYLGSTS